MSEGLDAMNEVETLSELLSVARRSRIFYEELIAQGFTITQAEYLTSSLVVSLGGITNHTRCGSMTHKKIPKQQLANWKPVCEIMAAH